MLILISPAKTLDYTATPIQDHTIVEFQRETKSLVSILKKKSSKELGSLMGISENLATLNKDRFKTFQKEFNFDNSKQALLAFKGDVYTKMDVENYQAADFEFAQTHLRILSGLYGLLKPLDLIQPYRLEMGTRLENKGKRNLYEFWGKKIAKAINVAAGDQPIVNLASQEYFKSVDLKTIKSPITTIHFKEFKNDGYQVVGFFAKQARGLMTDFGIKNRITDPNELKIFNLEGYEFADSLSKPTDWVFVR